jgi:hypothetical protein
MAAISNDRPFYLAQNRGLQTAMPHDELLHPERNRSIAADSATETQYFGFSVPEARIHALGYLWHHPNLKVLSGGLYVWRGIKPNIVYSELCDVRTYMSDTAISADLHSYRLDNGYGVAVIEPLKRHRMTYTDHVRDNHVDLRYEAVLPPVMFGDGNHFEQPVRATGELVLRGRRYEVDCYSVRDRSWGKARAEESMVLPPYSWMVGVFGSDFAFNLGVFDQVEGNPELEFPFVMPMAKTLVGGWLHRDGKLGRIVEASKRVVRSSQILLPTYVEFTAVDEHRRNLHVRGTLVAANNWQVSANTNFVVCLMRWECEGLVAYGDCQEGLWNDYLNRYGIGRLFADITGGEAR